MRVTDYTLIQYRTPSVAMARSEAVLQVFQSDSQRGSTSLL